MVKSVFSDGKGLVQSAGSGMVIEQRGATGAAYGDAASAVAVGASDTEMTVVQPAGSVLVDVGVALKVAIAGSSGNINVKVGTTDDGAELCAAAALMSSADAVAVGAGISVAGTKGEGDAALAFKANAPTYTASERTIFIRAEQSAAVTAGEYTPYIRFIKI